MKHLKHLNNLTIIIALLLCSCNNTISERYEDGSLKYQVNLENGKKHGLAKSYYRNGKIMSKAQWENGQLHGENLTYFENGIIKVKTDFIHGVESGVRLEYDSLGNLRKKYEMRAGQANGEFQYFNKEGKLILSGKMKNGRQFGWNRKYYDSGDLFGVYFIEGDSLKYLREYSKDGKLLDSKLPVVVKEIGKCRFQIGISNIPLDSINIGVLITNNIVDGIPVDTIDRVISTGNMLEYTLESCHIYNEDLRGIFFELNQQNNAIIAWDYFLLPINKD